MRWTILRRLRQHRLATAICYGLAVYCGWTAWSAGCHGGPELPAFTVPEGYTVELAAGPPLVGHPLMADFDDRGRLFVAEAAGLNLDADALEEQTPNFIRMLEDRDQDGRFDHATIFADKMTFPQGALWYDGALYVASPPNLWRLADMDGDGVADQRDVLVGKFGYTGNAADIHGPFLAPNGRLYWCDGRHGHEIRNADGEIARKGDGAYIFSCKPDGSDVRSHCGGGMDNPVEVDFTDEGDVLGTVNILYRQPRNDCLVHWIYGGVYPHSESVLGEFQRTGELLGPVHQFGHVAVSGMTRYRSGILDRNFRDNIFVAVFNTRAVQRIELAREGATFRATQQEFLSCSGSDFHPTDVLEDADGSLLVIDTGGWFRIGCPTSQIARPDIKGGIYRIRRQGTASPADPRGQRIPWSELRDDQLAERLDDPRFAVRARAILECSKRPATIVPSLQAVLRQQHGTRQRRNAVWALTRIGTEQARAAVRSALDDPSPGVRLATCCAVATTADHLAAPDLVQRLKQDTPPIRREAATAMGRIGSARCVPALLEALARPIDRAEEHAIIYALIETHAPTATALGLASTSTRTRRGALIALDQMSEGSLTATMVTPALTSDDPLLSETALQIFSRRSDWADHAVELLAVWIKDETNVARHRTSIQGLVTAFMADERLAQWVANQLSRPSASREWLLAAIGDGQRLPMRECLAAPLHELLASSHRPTVEATIAAVKAMDTDQFDNQLRKIADDTGQPVPVRVAAVEAVSAVHASLNEPAFEMLTGLLTGHASAGDRLRAIHVLRAARLSRQQLLALAPQLETAGPLELRELMKPYHGNADAEIGRQVVASVEQSPGFWSLLPADLRQAVEGCPPEVAELATPLINDLQSQEDQKLVRLAQLQPLLNGGDATRGRAVFDSEKAKCAACHRVGQDGGQIGPDLTHIGRIRNQRDLLEAIIFPSASFVREFPSYVVITVDGQVETGTIARQTEEMIFLQTQIGDPIAIPRNRIEEIAPSSVSIMPQGLDKILSQQELIDVIAYLVKLK